MRGKEKSENNLFYVFTGKFIINFSTALNQRNDFRRKIYASSFIGSLGSFDTPLIISSLDFEFIYRHDVTFYVVQRQGTNL